MLRGHRIDAVSTPFPRARAAVRQTTAAELVLAPLCFIAAGAAFAAEVLVGSGGDTTTFGALAVVPVFAASLRSYALSVFVAAFSVLLQISGAAAGTLSRNAAGMEISVFLLILAIVALQRSHAPLRALESPARPGDTEPAPLRPPPSLPRAVPDPVLHAPAPAAVRATGPVIRVAGVSALTTVAGDDVETLPAMVADRLTRRERDVVVLAVQGLTARQMGRRLFIGERTVETHLANAYGKLGVRSKLDLVRLVSSTAEDPTDLRTDTEAVERAPK